MSITIRLPIRFLGCGRSSARDETTLRRGRVHDAPTLLARADEVIEQAGARWLGERASLTPCARHFGLLALIQYDVASAQAFCHCSATCVQNCMGLIATVCKASAFAQVPAGLTLGQDFNFDSIADRELVIGVLICSSQASIM